MKNAQKGSVGAHLQSELASRNQTGFAHKVEVVVPLVCYCLIILMLFSSAVSVLAQEESATEAAQQEGSAFSPRKPLEAPQETSPNLRLSGTSTIDGQIQAPNVNREAPILQLQPNLPSAEQSNASIDSTKANLIAPPAVQSKAGAAVTIMKAVAGPSGPGVPQEFMLPNGLRVILLEEHAFPVVSCLVWYRVGSRYENPGATGLSHLVEHLVFQNIGNFKRNEFGASIIANGGQFNGFTSEDFTAFYSTVAPSKLDLVLHGEAERMRNAKFTKADVQAEVHNLLREFDDEARDPVAMLNREVHAIAYQQHPYRNPPGGWRNDAEHLTYEEARAFYDRYFSPDNASLVLVGDFKKDVVHALLKKHFMAVAKAPNAIVPLKINERFASYEKRITMKHGGKKESLVVAYAAPSVADNDAAAMSVLEKLLNGQISGRLKKQLLDTRVCSGAQSSFELKKDPGLFVLNLTATGGTSLGKVLDASDSLMSQLRSQLITDADLSRAKRQAEFEFFNEADGPYRAGFHLGYFDTLINWKAASAWPEKIRAVNAADIQRVARRYLVNDSRVVGQLVSTAASTVAPKTTVPAVTQKLGSDAYKTNLLENFVPGLITNLITPCRNFSNLRLAAYKQADSTVTTGRPTEAKYTVVPDKVAIEKTKKILPATVETSPTRAFNPEVKRNGAVVYRTLSKRDCL